MPTRAEIQKIINERKGGAQDEVRRSYLANAAKISKRDTILYASGWTSPKRHEGVPPNFLSLVIEDIQGFMAALHGLEGDKLDLIIHSPGGSLEAVDQVVQYLRGKYSHVRAIVPQNAMSVACMLACACDEIVMGKQSALGPIDPQLSWNSSQGAVSAAAQSLLDELDAAKKDIGANPNLAPIWATRLKGFPPGIFATCKTTMELSESKVSEWLSKYMFKSEPESAKPNEISSWLASATIHKTHGRPIGFELCKEKGLKVFRLEDDQKFQDAILSVFHASAVTFEVTSCIKIIESHKGRGHYVTIQHNKK